MFLFLENIGFSETIAIVLFIIIFFGPKKIPEIARGLSQGIRTMKNATEDIKKEIMKESESINPAKDITEEINKAKQIMNETKDDVDDVVGSIKR